MMPLSRTHQVILGGLVIDRLSVLLQRLFNRNEQHYTGQTMRSCKAKRQHV